MAEFHYTAADRNGKKIEGKMEATNEGELRMALRGQGLRPVKISKAGIAQIDLGNYFVMLLGGGGTVAPDRLMNFIKQLHVMITSGVPLIQAIELFSEQETDPLMRKILNTTKEKIKSGTFLWESFAAYPNVFERVFVSLIRAGENSGTLDVMLSRVGKYLENSYRLKKLIRGSMVYPVTVLFISVAVVSLMLLMVIPKFEEMIVGNGGAMPALTQLVINLSHWFSSNFLFIFITGAIVTYLFRLYAISREGKVVIQRILIQVPLFGDLIKKSGVARFARTMATLLSSGVPMVDSLEICKSASEHIAFEDAVGEMKKEIEMGATVSSAMHHQKVFPKMATQMVSVSKNPGNMDKMLERVADFYEEEVQNTVQGMMKLIEPFMLVFLGSVVGGLMIAMYLPIFQMAGSTNQ